MDDDKEKSAIEKMIDKVNDAVENIANTAFGRRHEGNGAETRSQAGRWDDQRASLHFGSDRRGGRACSAICRPH